MDRYLCASALGCSGLLAANRGELPGWGGLRLLGAVTARRTRLRTLSKRRTSRAASLAHQRSALDTRDIVRLELVTVRRRNNQLKLHILALNQVLVLVAHANRGIVDKDILARLLSVVHGNETVTGLVVEPLHLAQNTRGLCCNGIAHDGITRLYDYICDIVFI